MDTKVLSPFNEKPRFSTGDQRSVTSRVAHLVFPQSPATIFWRVITTIVTPLQFMLWCWWFAHVLKERAEVFPLGTYTDPTCTVVLVGVVAWIVATVAHVPPNSIGTRAVLTMRTCTTSLTSQYWLCFRGQMILAYITLVTTITTHAPVRWVSWQLFKQRLLTKLLPYLKGKSFTHGT